MVHRARFADVLDRFDLPQLGRVPAMSTIAKDGGSRAEPEDEGCSCSGVYPFVERASSRATIAAAIELPIVRAMAFMLVATPVVSPVPPPDHRRAAPP